MPMDGRLLAVSLLRYDDELKATVDVALELESKDIAVVRFMEEWAVAVLGALKQRKQEMFVSVPEVREADYIPRLSLTKPARTYEAALEPPKPVEPPTPLRSVDSAPLPSLFSDIRTQEASDDMPTPSLEASETPPAADLAVCIEAGGASLQVRRPFTAGAGAYVSLARALELATEQEMSRVRPVPVSFFACVSAATVPQRTRGKDHFSEVRLYDDATAADATVQLNWFANSPHAPRGAALPVVPGSLLRVSRATPRVYQGKIQLVSHISSSLLQLPGTVHPRVDWTLTEHAQVVRLRDLARAGHFGGQSEQTLRNTVHTPDNARVLEPFATRSLAQLTVPAPGARRFLCEDLVLATMPPPRTGGATLTAGDGTCIPTLVAVSGHLAAAPGVDASVTLQCGARFSHENQSYLQRLSDTLRKHRAYFVSMVPAYAEAMLPSLRAPGTAAAPFFFQLRGAEVALLPGSAASGGRIALEAGPRFSLFLLHPRHPLVASASGRALRSARWRCAPAHSPDARAFVTLFQAASDSGFSLARCHVLTPAQCFTGAGGVEAPVVGRTSLLAAPGARAPLLRVLLADASGVFEALIGPDEFLAIFGNTGTAACLAGVRAPLPPAADCWVVVSAVRTEQPHDGALLFVTEAWQ